ncbi:MAG: glycosyltransferase family 4 protein [Ignavibacteriae bacterium]|nr:glycosyltransferase family 4 protein [Ignavibacteriota bacterium]
MKTLLIVTTGLQRLDRAELLLKEAADEFPRVSLFGTKLNSDILDERYLKTVTLIRRFLYKLIPTAVAQVLEAFYIKNKYDVIISWSERRALLFALLLKLSGSNTKHVALMYWMSKPKQSILFHLVHNHFDRIITWSSVQRDYALNVLGIPASRIAFVRHPVDQQFWRPIKQETDMISSAGSEMRDYATLLEAMKGLNMKCHIATNEIRIVKNHTAVRLNKNRLGALPPNVSIGFLQYKELRDLYARSRFVVVPLFPSDTDNGINTILEAMAMGKAVICSRIKGQVDVIREGKTGIFVPPGDSKALRNAIEYLWNNPSVAQQMGTEARLYIEKYHSIEQFVDDVKSLVEEVITKDKTKSKCMTSIHHESIIGNIHGTSRPISS